MAPVWMRRTTVKGRSQLVTQHGQLIRLTVHKIWDNLRPLVIAVLLVGARSNFAPQRSTAQSSTTQIESKSPNAFLRLGHSFIGALPRSVQLCKTPSSSSPDIELIPPDVSSNSRDFDFDPSRAARFTSLSIAVGGIHSPRSTVRIG